MKNRKEYIILAVIIVALGAYLAFRNADRIHYRLPQPPEIDTGKITGIEISGKGQSVSLSRKDGKWLIEPRGYPADTAKVTRILSHIGTLKITDMVSRSKNYSRYELGGNEKISVKAFSGTSLLREYAVGKAAPSGKHTFIMLPGDAHVYQAEENFREDFQQGAAGLRDKKVLSFSPDEISRVSITAGKTNVILTRRTLQAKPGDKAAAVQGAVWTDDTGRELNKSDVTRLISSVNRLECSEYLDETSKAALGSPEMTITFTGTKDYSLSLYPKQGDKVPAVSSGSPYAFVLPDFLQENIRKGLETFSSKK